MAYVQPGYDGGTKVSGSQTEELPTVPGRDVHKVVVHLKDGTLMRGYFEEALPITLEDLLEKPHHRIPRRLTLRNVENGGCFEIDVATVKAVYFVKSFEGERDKKKIRFYTYGPAVQGIWVEIRFRDGEILEGMIQNSLHHLVDDGFLLTPSDPESNNHVLYVPKDSIADYRVLGVQTIG